MLHFGSLALLVQHVSMVGPVVHHVASFATYLVLNSLHFDFHAWLMVIRICVRCEWGVEEEVKNGRCTGVWINTEMKRR